MLTDTPQQINSNLPGRSWVSVFYGIWTGRNRAATRGTGAAIALA